MAHSGAGFARLKYYHPLEAEDGALVGPSSEVVTGAGSFGTTGAKHGNAFDAGSDGSLFTAAISGYSDADNARTLTHFFWTPANPDNDQRPFYMDNSGATTSNSLFLRWDGTVKGFELVKKRAADVPGNPGMKSIFLQTDFLDLTAGNPIAMVCYLDGDTAAQARLIANGVLPDQFAVLDVSGVLGSGPYEHLRIGNHPDTTEASGVIDEFVMIQDPALTGALVVTWDGLYRDTRGFGHYPLFASLVLPPGGVGVGSAITLNGQGFGGDVLAKINGVAVDTQVRVNEGTITFTVPSVAAGTYDITIENVSADVTWTESSAITVVDLEAATFKVVNQVGDPVSSTLVSVFDQSNVLVDSGLTDVNGLFATAVAADDYKVIATKDTLAGGNAIPVTVVSS